MARTSVGEYYTKRKLVDQLQRELEELEKSDALKSKLQVEGDLKAMLAKYSVEPQDLVDALVALYPDDVALTSSPKIAKRASKATSSPARGKSSVTPPRKEKIFTNPHTSETILTKGSNHRVLNEWRRQYGQAALDNWWAYTD